MKPDAQLKTEITQELEWDPSINADHVGVAVEGGIVTLTGHLETFAAKFAIERAVQRVGGVRAVAVELDVKLAPNHKRSDSEIAQAAESAFKWHALIPAERIRIKVEKGWITLSGELDWEYQRHAAERAVRALIGVVGVSNQMTLKPTVTPANISHRIRDAMARHAEREANHIEVTVTGSTVALRGKVGSWAERSAAQGAAWSAPGIARVVNELTISTTV
jgi:osmotically-inducible protein OsmY